jgi:multiple sugar transport system permease protein
VSQRRLKGLREGLLFVSPFLVGFSLLTVYAVIKSFHYSFTEFDGVNAPEWVGLAKYRELAVDKLFWLSLWNTVYFTVFAVPLGLTLALMLALLLNLKLRGIALYRALFFVPSIVPLVATSVLWLWFLNPQYGALNGLLRVLGLPEPGWLGEPGWVKPSLILMSLWGIGGTMVLYLAALQDVPEQLYEAAEIDGAGPWQRIWHITLPTISPVILATLILGLIGSFQYFTQAYVMLGGTGGPGDRGLFYCLYLFRKAFAYQDLGGACAMAWILFVVVVALTLLTLRLSIGRVHYEGG